MEYEGLPDVRRRTDLWNDLDDLRQNHLMREAQFLSFVRDRGSPVVGVLEGEPSEFLARGWLACDKVGLDGSPLFHPFRFFPIHRILDQCDLRIANKTALCSEGYLRLATKSLGGIPKDEHFRMMGKEWSRVVDLAVLLEPLYWPRIVGRQTVSTLISEKNYRRVRQSFDIRALNLVKTLDSKLWKRVHECLLIDAFRLDDNPHLYVLLRVGKWERREKLKGKLSGALWLRHMAEVLRRAFEGAFDQRWPEEYEGAGNWTGEVKKRTFGAERPLDDAIAAKPFIASEFGLFTSSSVRWYVEGDTEYFAFLELLSDPGHFGIELINLRGEIAARKGNAAMKLQDFLREDRTLRRFSMISLDGDVEPNLKFLRRQLAEDNLVGGVALHTPDFEFANFSLRELVEIAAGMDESMGFDGSPVRDADYGPIHGAKALEHRYRSVSARAGANLKCESWGRALGRHANKHPKNQGGHERSMIGQMRAAMFGWSNSYTSHYAHSTLDPNSFESILRRKTFVPASKSGR